MLNHSPLAGVILHESRGVLGERTTQRRRHFAWIGLRSESAPLQFHNQFCRSHRLAFHQHPLGSSRVAEFAKRRSWTAPNYPGVPKAGVCKTAFLGLLQALDLVKCRAIVLVNRFKSLVPLRSGAAFEFGVDIHGPQFERVSIGRQSEFSEARNTKTVPNIHPLPFLLILKTSLFYSSNSKATVPILPNSVLKNRVARISRGQYHQVHCAATT